MQTPTPILPESEIKRLSEAADEYGKLIDKEYREHAEEDHFQGGQTEYIASLSRQKDMAIELANYINENYLYKMNGFWKKSECESYDQKTDDQLYSEFLESLNKQL